MKRIFKTALFSILIIFLTVFCFFFVGKPKPAEEMHWGVIFSHKHSEPLGLDWRENYLAILDDLKVKRLHIIVYWDMVERERGQYDFSDTDWKIEEAVKRDAKITLVLGRKVPRWPECFTPGWAEKLPQEEQSQALLGLIERIILRYRDIENIIAWQVENEPFFAFGVCPPPDEELLQKEVDLVRKLDNNNRPIVITDSGEIPFWFKASRFGDIVGHTLYRTVWFHQYERYFSYPIPPVFYNRKAWLINTLFGKKVICTELQAEPWGPTLLYDSPLEEQKKTMDLERFKKAVEFAKKTGNDTFYFWGVEWWYWMKTVQNQPEIWNEAKSIFQAD